MKISWRSRRALIGAAFAAGALAVVPSAMANNDVNLAVGVTGPSQIAPGENGTWTITVTNAGTDWVMASRILVDSPTLGHYGLTPDAAPEDGWLGPGATMTFTEHGRLDGGFCEEGKASVEATVRLSKGTETSLEDNEDWWTSDVSSCRTDLGITKSAGLATAQPGDTISWTMVVTNHGDTGVLMSDITVTDPMLADLAPVDAPADGWLDPGASVTFTGTSVATVEQCGTLTNTASVGLGGVLPDADPSDDQARASVAIEGVACAPVRAQVLPVINCPATRLAVGVSAPRSASAGQIMRVVLTARNAGSDAARSARLRYRLPSGTSLHRRPAGATLRGGVLVVNLGDMAAGDRRRTGITLLIDRASGRRVHGVRLSGACAATATAIAATRVTPIAGPRIPAVAG